MYDDTKTADDSANAEANISWSYDAAEKLAKVTVSIIGDVLGEEFSIAMPAIAELQLFGMERLAKLTGITCDTCLRGPQSCGALGHTDSDFCSGSGDSDSSP